MFLDIKDLAVRKQVIRKSYAPGSIDYRLEATCADHLDLGLDFPGDPNLAFDKFCRGRDFQRLDLFDFRRLVIDATWRVALTNDLFPDSKVLDI